MMPVMKQTLQDRPVILLSGRFGRAWGVLPQYPSFSPV